MKLFAVLIVTFTCFAETPDATEIMRRVAGNQDRAQTARAAWVYDQNVFVRLQRSAGELAREETRDYVVAPTEKGAGRKLIRVEGKIGAGKKSIPYTTAGFRTKNADIDGALVEGLAKDINWRKDTVGPISYLMPLSAEHQNRYTFTLDGEEQYQGFDVWRIRFRQSDGEDNWSGELLVEKNEFQPLVLTSHWDSKVPVAVTMALGVSVKQVGGKITWQRAEKDVWFPAVAGGEMKLRVLFFYARNIAYRSVSSAFRRTDVQEFRRV